MRFILLIAFLSGSFNLRAQETEYGVCSLTDENKAKIEICQRLVTSKKCEDIPSEMKKDCFSEYSQEEFSFVKSCGVDGTKKFINDTWDGVKDIASRAYSTVTDNKAYSKKVRDDAVKNCENNRAVKDARDEWNQIVKNIGLDAAYTKYGQRSNDAYQKCIRYEERKGRNLGVSIDIPDVQQLTETMSCMSSHAQTEFGCSVLLPALGTGGYGGVKALLSLNKAKKAARQLGLAGKEFKTYEAKVKNKLTPAELASLKHQEDLIDALSNPEVSARIGLSDPELKNLVQGIIDSDAGKLDSFKAHLTKPTADSNELLNVIKGNENSTPAGRAFQEFMSENEMGGKGLLNKDLTNDQIREIFNGAPAAQGYLHELPGMSEAIKDLNAVPPRITPEQFKKRLGANLFHNGPQAGFWEFFNDTLLPAHFDSKFVRDKFTDHSGLNNFFKNTAFQGETAPNGFVKPKYPSPLTKESMIHTTFDRLSQGTSGGNTKIFLEQFNKQLAENPNAKMGELKNLSGQSGLTAYRDMLVGNPLAKPKSVNSNGIGTAKQLDALYEVIAKSKKLTLIEKKKMREIVKASRDRTLAFDDYVKKFADFEAGPDGSVTRITLKDSNGNYIGTITKDTPASDSARLFEKFYNKEESLNGHPIKDLMKPRVLTNSEKAAYGLSPALAFHYCNPLKFKGGKPVKNPGEVEPTYESIREPGAGSVSQ